MTHLWWIAHDSVRRIAGSEVIIDVSDAPLDVEQYRGKWLALGEMDAVCTGIGRMPAVVPLPVDAELIDQMAQAAIAMGHPECPTIAQIEAMFGPVPWVQSVIDRAVETYTAMGAPMASPASCPTCGRAY